jgi:predicted metal-dependent HD superfamily phosphohydrolase
MRHATEQRFFDLCHSVGISEDIVSEAWRDLVLRYSEVHRFYHTLDHIDRMLGWLDSASTDQIPIELAIWYHDVVYDPRSTQNESLSASLFRTGIGSHISPVVVSDVCRLILATDHKCHLSQADDESLLIDIDLSIFGEDGDVYDDYSRNIRREYAHVPDAAYVEGRRAVLSGFLERTIYTNMPFRSFEATARDNILREIAGLNKFQGQQDADSTEGSASA